MANNFQQLQWMQSNPSGNQMGTGSTGAYKLVTYEEELQIERDYQNEVRRVQRMRGKKVAGAKKPGSKVKKNPLFPVIGGQQKAYLVKQLKDFKEGKRANDPAGMMAMVAKGLSDKEIEAVAEYVSSL